MQVLCCNTLKLIIMYAENLIEKSEFNRFGIISFVILIVGCMGGLAVGLGAVEHVFTLALVVIPTMLTLSLLLAVAPMKFILTAGVVSTVIDTILILYYLLA